MDLSIITITYDNKYSNMEYSVQLRDICHNITKLLYGKTYSYSDTGVLGTPGVLLIGKNKLKKSRFIVTLPSEKIIGKKTGAVCSGTMTRSYSRGITEMIRDIDNMIDHARKSNIIIEISVPK